MPRIKKTESEIADWGNFKLVIEDAYHQSRTITAANGKSYDVKKMCSDPQKIFFCVNGICDEVKYVQGIDGYVNFMRHFTKHQDKFPVEEYHGDNHKMYFITAFHPHLSWSEDLSHILFK